MLHCVLTACMYCSSDTARKRKARHTFRQARHSFRQAWHSIPIISCAATAAAAAAGFCAWHTAGSQQALVWQARARAVCSPRGPPCLSWTQKACLPVWYGSLLQTRHLTLKGGLGMGGDPSIAYMLCRMRRYRRRTELIYAVSCVGDMVCSEPEE